MGEPGPRRKEVGSAALDLPSFKRGCYAVGSNKLTAHIEPRSAHNQFYILGDYLWAQYRDGISCIGFNEKIN